MKTLDIDRKFDPSPEENRAAIEAIKADIAGTAAKLSEAVHFVSLLGNHIIVEAKAKTDKFNGRIQIAMISKNFVGEYQAKVLATHICNMINAVGG